MLPIHEGKKYYASFAFAAVSMTNIQRQPLIGPNNDFKVINSILLFVNGVHIFCALCKHRPHGHWFQYCTISADVAAVVTCLFLLYKYRELKTTICSKMADQKKSSSNPNRKAAEVAPGDRCREVLDNAGADVNLTHDDGLTPLMFAVKEDHLPCVKELIKAGADVNLLDGQGQTPLIFAANKGHVQCVKELMKAGDDVNKPNRNGGTPVLRAADIDHADVVETLINAGADVNHANKWGQTALMHTAQKGHVNLLSTLLTAGVDVNLKNNKGEDALYQAAYSANYKSIELLLEAGVDVEQ